MISLQLAPGLGRFPKILPHPGEPADLALCCHPSHPAVGFLLLEKRGRTSWTRCREETNKSSHLSCRGWHPGKMTINPDTPGGASWVDQILWEAKGTELEQGQVLMIPPSPTWAQRKAGFQNPKPVPAGVVGASP